MIDMKQIVVFSLLALLCFSVKGQIKAGEYYYGYEVKKGQNIPDVIKIKVTDINMDMKKITDAVTKKPLQGTYFISETRIKFYVGSIKNGIPDGDWEIYYQEKLDKKATYVNGKLDGKLYSYFDDGRISSEKTYKDGIIQHYISHYNNNRLATEEFYNEKGQKHGHIISYDRKGKKLEDETYVNGRLDGKSVKYENQSTVENEYKDGNLIFSRETYTNGNLKHESSYNEDGKRNGRCVYGYENGKVEHEDFYLNGKKQEEKHYFKNGLLQSEKTYDGNEKTIRAVYYNEDPHYVEEEDNYMDGINHGATKIYEGKDLLRRDTYYVHGDAIREKIYENGKLKSLYLADETGKLVRVEEYDKAGKKTYKNKEYKKHPSITLKEDASGIIDIEIKD
jgi:antitoxin component YwqK of YwqJK toxin-antitoxin module